jgi:hypothetical protein
LIGHLLRKPQKRLRCDPIRFSNNKFVRRIKSVVESGPRITRYRRPPSSRAQTRL